MISSQQDTHECFVDCEPVKGRNGEIHHIMYPTTEVNWTGTVYGPQNHTRRSWRATGQDETRNVRKWNLEHGYR